MRNPSFPTQRERVRENTKSVLMSNKGPGNSADRLDQLERERRPSAANADLADDADSHERRMPHNAPRVLLRGERSRPNQQPPVPAPAPGLVPGGVPVPIAPNLANINARNRGIAWLKASIARANQRRIAGSGTAQTIGRRLTMEDTLVVMPAFAATPDAAYDFYAVFDGHGGSRISDECKERLHLEVVAEVWKLRTEGMAESPTLWARAMIEAFNKLDAKLMVDLQRDAQGLVGSTAVVLVVGEKWLLVANLGDSRAVLCRNGQVKPFSFDHKPKNLAEATRIRNLGGHIIHTDCERVEGILATTRSFGDYLLKQYIISEPEVIAAPRSPGDEFVILASDGLWDVISSEAACRLVRFCLIEDSKKIGTPRHNSAAAAAFLAKHAIEKGSNDNITVIVVAFKPFL